MPKAHAKQKKTLLVIHYHCSLHWLATTADRKYWTNSRYPMVLTSLYRNWDSLTTASMDAIRHSTAPCLDHKALELEIAQYWIINTTYLFSQRHKQPLEARLCATCRVRRHVNYPHWSLSMHRTALFLRASHIPRSFSSCRQPVLRSFFLIWFRLASVRLRPVGHNRNWNASHHHVDPDCPGACKTKQ